MIVCAVCELWQTCRRWVFGWDMPGQIWVCTKRRWLSDSRGVVGVGRTAVSTGDSNNCPCAVCTLLKAFQGSVLWGLDSLWLVYLSWNTVHWALCGICAATPLKILWQGPEMIHGTDFAWCMFSFYQSWIPFIHVSMTKTAWIAHSSVCT